MSNYNSEESISEGLKNLIDKANVFADTAAEVILQAYRYAIEIDGMSPIKAGDTLKRELHYSPQWINEQIPEEAKHTEKRHKPKLIDEKLVSHKTEQEINEVVNKDSSRLESSKNESPSLKQFREKGEYIQHQQPQPQQQQQQEEQYIANHHYIRSSDNERWIDVEDKIIQQEETSTTTEDFFIPANRFRKVFMDLMKVRVTAERTGVYITKEWEVKTD